MKKNNYILLFLVAFIFIACGNKNNNLYERYNLTPNDTAKVVFDIDNFNKKRIRDSIRFDSLYPGSSFYDSPFYSCVFIDENGVKVEQMSTNEGYQERCYFPDSIFYDIRSFFPNGNIYRKSQSLINSYTSVYKSIYFDEQGNVTKVVNNEENYEFNTDSVLNYIKKMGIDILDDSRYVGIFRGVGTEYDYLPGVRYWHIEYKYNQDSKRDILLDATTGGVLIDTIFIPQDIDIE